ncbi:hypothetical protein KM043_010004 [Ampulex compressa]|nr:hypothetical protein KM043_010004 [Ampulex compressa]
MLGQYFNTLLLSNVRAGANVISIFARKFKRFRNFIDYAPAPLSLARIPDKRYFVGSLIIPQGGTKGGRPRNLIEKDDVRDSLHFDAAFRWRDSIRSGDDAVGDDDKRGTAGGD